jgi:hypothetical protein
MTKQHKTSESVKAISGWAFIGIGLHILSENLSGVAHHLRHLLDVPGGDTLGVLPSITLAASQTARAYALDQSSFLDGFLYMLTSLWPLLLVIVGTVLLRNLLTDKVKEVPAPDEMFRNNFFGNKRAQCRFRCPSFDV